MSDSILCTEKGIRQVQEALRQQDLDGWLLYEFRGANPIAKSMLGVGKTTRRAFFLIPAEGEPQALLHAIEGSSWRHWPWARSTYSGWRQMEEALGEMLRGRGRLAMEVSPGAAVPTLDYVPAGLAEVLLRSGIEAASSGNLVSRFYSVWTDAQLADHLEASEILPRVAMEAFRKAASAIGDGKPTTEGALSDWIRSEFTRHGLTDNMECIVAVGRTASDPHYAPEGAGETILRGDLLLIDLWAGKPGSVPADQTWMGMMGSEVDARTQEIWEAVRDARDAALAFLKERFDAGEEVRGYEVDDVSRGVIVERGYGAHFVHRTGHSIDTVLHGSGPNLDNLETRDDRLLIPGVGFSVEPGIYLPGDIGVRSEVNVYWSAEGPVVTPAEIQREIFFFLDG
ncbi:MAG: M24 family metallopeptidase [Longimicrobiales bacterium]